MLKYGLFALFIATLAAPGAAQAQTKKGANGGTVVTSQGHPIEFVLKGQDIVFYLGDDDGSPLATKDVHNGRATVQDGGKTMAVSLQPASPNLMIGKLQAPLGPKARIVFSASLHGHALTARYVID
jgi:hypothetical protein